jgi:hypothetical protein
LGLVLYKTTTTGFTCGYYLAPRVTAFQIQPLQGWRFTKPLPQVSPVAIHIQPLQGWYFTKPLPQVSPVAIHIQPLQGWRFTKPLPQVSPVAIHIQPLQGWHFTKPLPQVSPVAIISLRSLLRFIFNPFGVDACPKPKSTGFTKAIISRSELLRFILSRVASYCVSTPTGLALYKTTTTGLSRCARYCVSLKLLSRSASYCVSLETPLGLVIFICSIW